MNRGLLGFAVASSMFVVSLNCEIAAAAEKGFYLGVAGGRSEQRLDKEAGIGPPPPVVDMLPPGGVFNPFPSDQPPIPWLPPPPSGVVAVLLPAGMTADETDVGWNVAVGYRVNRYLAAELSYVDAGDASLTERYSAPPSTVPSPGDILRSYTVSSRGPAVSVLGSLPLSERWEVFVRGGVLFAKQDVRTRTLSEDPQAIVIDHPLDRSYSDEVFNVGAGVQWAFLPRWTARLEYQRSDNLQRNDIMGESRLEQAALSVLFGL
jgi:opacity protein-like surface antigen